MRRTSEVRRTVVLTHALELARITTVSGEGTLKALPVKPEEQARQIIDELLAAAGWAIQGVRDLNLGAAGGVAVLGHPSAGQLRCPDQPA